MVHLLSDAVGAVGNGVRKNAGQQFLEGLKGRQDELSPEWPEGNWASDGTGKMDAGAKKVSGSAD